MLAGLAAACAAASLACDEGSREACTHTYASQAEGGCWAMHTHTHAARPGHALFHTLSLSLSRCSCTLGMTRWHGSSALRRAARSRAVLSKGGAPHWPGRGEVYTDCCLPAASLQRGTSSRNRHVTARCCISAPCSRSESCISHRARITCGARGSNAQPSDLSFQLVLSTWLQNGMLGVRIPLRSQRVLLACRLVSLS